MHNIKFIRENPDLFDKLLNKRGIESQSLFILDLDKECRSLTTVSQNLQQEKNALVDQIAVNKQKKNDTTDLERSTKDINEKLQNSLKQAQEYKQRLDDILMRIPNLLHDDVPVGKDEADNVVVRVVGKAPVIDQPLSHYDLGEKLGMMDFELAAKLSGPRFTVLKGDLARLDRALSAFMIDNHVSKYGYTEIAAPVLVKSENLYGTSNLPKFEQDLFVTTDGKYLIPTAEVTLTNIVRDVTLNSQDLPLRFTGLSSCFRSEAGSAGKDTKGMLRNHQFNKVELVSIVDPCDEMKEHERMLSVAEEILQKLKLPYRVVLLCSGDIGFASKKTYDLEVWLPFENKYREISSCSVCGDFQARRMNAKFKQQDGQKCFVSTLNGSGLAVGRTLLAILENYQQKDGSIIIPDVLVSYMHGQTVIKK